MSRVSIAMTLLASPPTRAASSARASPSSAADLESRRTFDRLAASDGESAGFVCPRNPPRALRDVEAHALGRAKRFIPKLGIPNVSIRTATSISRANPKTMSR